MSRDGMSNDSRHARNTESGCNVLHKVVVAFESVDKALASDHRDESY